MRQSFAQLVVRQREIKESPPVVALPDHKEHYSFGWLPALAVSSALSLLIVSLAFVGGRSNLPLAQPLYWFGLLALFLPFAFRLTVLETTREERLALVILLGLGLYGVKLLHSPVGFTFSDEFQHWRSVNEIIASGRLFQRNILLPAATYFPSLHLLTHALVSLTGLPVFAAGVILLGIARVLLMTSLFLFYERAAQSARTAGLAVLLYTANPSFVYFDSQFAYESLAIPVIGATLFALALRPELGKGVRPRLNLFIMALMMTVVITHHVSSYALLALLGLWSILRLVARHRAPSLEDPRIEALVMLVLAVTWFIYMATLLIAYLEPVLSSATTELVRVLTSGEGSTQTFASVSGLGNLTPERVLSYMAIAVVLLAMSLGLRNLWKRRRTTTLVALTLGVGALAYPMTLLMRLTPRGMEVGGRASPFVFMPLAFVIAVGVLAIWLKPEARSYRQAVFLLGAAVLFAGGITTGWPAWARIPGPYLVVADTRSIEPQGIQAALWARAHLPSQSRLIADRVNRMLMATYGQQRPTTSMADRVRTYRVVLSETLGAVERETLQVTNTRYVLIDERLDDARPLLGMYFENGENVIRRASNPLTMITLTKFEREAWINRVFDSGDLVLYDLENWTHRAP